VRLISYKKKLEEYRRLLEIDVYINDSFNGKQSIVKNWNVILSNLNGLKKDYPFLSSDIDATILLGKKSLTDDGCLKMNEVSFKNFCKKCEKLKSDIDLSISLLATVIIDDAGGLYIRVPENQTMKQAKYIINTLEFITNECMPVRQLNGNRDAILSGVEHGSIWLIIDISCEALAFLGELFATISRTINEVFGREDLLLYLRKYSSLEKSIESFSRETLNEIYKKLEVNKHLIMTKYRIETNEVNDYHVNKAVNEIFLLILHEVIMLSSDKTIDNKFPSEDSQMSIANRLNEIRSESNGKELINSFIDQELMPLMDNETVK